MALARRSIPFKSVIIESALGTIRWKYGYTHALRIPLATPISRPQFERSLRQVMTDPNASHIHPDVFGPPDTQCLNLGSLCLESRESMDKALEVLASLRVYLCHHLISSASSNSK